MTMATFGCRINLNVIESEIGIEDYVASRKKERKKERRYYWKNRYKKIEQETKCIGSWKICNCIHRNLKDLIDR